LTGHFFLKRSMYLYTAQQVTSETSEELSCGVGGGGATYSGNLLIRLEFRILPAVKVPPTPLTLARRLHPGVIPLIRDSSGHLPVTTHE
jgi:hypothetical protein